MSKKRNNPLSEYTLMASDETAYVGIIREVRTAKFYQAFEKNPTDMIPMSLGRVYAFLSKAVLIHYCPEIPLKSISEWTEKARKAKQGPVTRTMIEAEMKRYPSRSLSELLKEFDEHRPK